MMGLYVFNNRIYIGGEKRSHIVWNFYNPDNQRKKGMIVHHKDENPMNDEINNLQLVNRAQHCTIHHTNKFVSEETREKLSEINKGKKLSIEQIEKMSKSLKGRPAWNKGKQFSEESRKKMSESQTGKKLSEETKQKIAEASRNQVWTEERKRNISNAKKGKSYNRPGYRHSEETKIKMSLSQKGKVRGRHSEETKKKMSESRKKYFEQKRGVYV